MGIASVMMQAFNGTASEHNLIGTRTRKDSETIRIDNATKIVRADEIASYGRSLERAAMAKRQVKVSIPKAPWE